MKLQKWKLVVLKSQESNRQWCLAMGYAEIGIIRLQAS